ncbi:hypothetical protein NDU88_010348 [Pleurodeles waltl]|uniref:Uncharacterized protein n=1 Tax=Pleurodeles waltl TaxID=8319 RepID=A0AAV7PZU3_PLEWA|nr:hypothetical protein NDU88_010348 [Pleurodeles waltl]
MERSEPPRNLRESAVRFPDSEATRTTEEKTFRLRKGVILPSTSSEVVFLYYWPIFSACVYGKQHSGTSAPSAWRECARVLPVRRSCASCLFCNLATGELTRKSLRLWSCC